jgi:sensor histidine kinase regulating citrate/malate metabolism
VMIVVIFLISTISFTGLLLRNIQDETFRQLSTDLKVLQFSLESKQAEHTSDAILVAKDPALIQAVISKDRTTLNSITQSYILTKKYSSLVVLDQNGQVIARGEDPEKIGNIMTNELLVRRAQAGPSASLEIKEGVLSPQVLVSAATPIQSTDQIIGTVVLSTSIDNAFVDGIKKATGLEASIYGSNTLSATTLLAADEKTRLVGIKEENQRIVGNVLQEGNSVNTSVNIANAPFFASYIPLNDIDSTPVGMMSVARTQESILQTAGRSIELTFIIATIMLIVSIIPSFLIARYMANQL